MKHKVLIKHHFTMKKNLPRQITRCDVISLTYLMHKRLCKELRWMT